MMFLWQTAAITPVKYKVFMMYSAEGETAACRETDRDFPLTSAPLLMPHLSLIPLFSHVLSPCHP